MALAKDTFTTIGSGTGNISGTHTTAASPKGASVIIHQFANGTDQVTAVTYGGVAMSRVGAALHTTGETGAAYLYFLGSGIPSGNQTVSVTVGGAAIKAAHCLTWTASGNTEIVDSDVSVADTSDGPAISLTFGGRTCSVLLAGLSGEDAVADVSPTAGWTFDYEGDAGSIVAVVTTYDTIAATDVSATWVQTANDHIAVAAAIAEITTESTGVAALASQAVGLAADAIGQSDGAAALADQAGALASDGTVYVYPAYGHATPDAGEAAQSWSLWNLGAGAAVIGDGDYGALAVPPGVVCDGPVVDMGSLSSRQITLDTKYGTNQGNVSYLLRGSDTTFAWNDLAPSWVAYTGPVIQAWRYVQARIVGV
jgi:hypothetical protein